MGDMPRLKMKGSGPQALQAMRRRLEARQIIAQFALAGYGSAWNSAPNRTPDATFLGLRLESAFQNARAIGSAHSSSTKVRENQDFAAPRKARPPAFEACRVVHPGEGLAWRQRSGANA